MTTIPVATKTWQGGYTQLGPFFHKVTWPLVHMGLVILISLSWFVGLECKRLSRHRLLVQITFALFPKFKLTTWFKRSYSEIHFEENRQELSLKQI